MYTARPPSTDRHIFVFTVFALRFCQKYFSYGPYNICVPGPGPGPTAPLLSQLDGERKKKHKLAKSAVRKITFLREMGAYIFVGA